MNQDLHNELIARIDRREVERRAMWVLRGLLASNWAITDYQPGDGTRYKLCFTRMRRPSWAPTARFDNGFAEGYVVVSWLNHGAYQFDLLNPHAYHDFDYVGEKFNTKNLPSIYALGILFQEFTRIVRENDITIARVTENRVSFRGGPETFTYDVVKLVPIPVSPIDGQRHHNSSITDTRTSMEIGGWSRG